MYKSLIEVHTIFKTELNYLLNIKYSGTCILQLHEKQKVHIWQRQTTNFC